jgi:hypothetical protein
VLGCSRTATATPAEPGDLLLGVSRTSIGLTRSEGKVVSVFEPSTEIIRKGKISNPTEFGKMVKLQEAENQIVTDFNG